jgi:TRAP transporter TAXI family solute receptor
MGTGETGTFSNYTGRAICRMINRQAEDINCKIVPGPDDAHNLTNLEGGALDMSISDSRMLHDAVNKTGYFEFFDISYDTLRVIFPLYDIPITLIARKDADVKSLDSVKGKRINAGAPGSPEHLAMDTIMELKSWTYRDFSLVEELPHSLSQDAMAFCHGTTEVMLRIGVHPDTSIQKLLKLCKAEMINMDDDDINKLINDHPAYLNIDVPKNTYPSQSKGVTTFGTQMKLITSESLDEETVYKIVDAIYSNRKYLMNTHPALSSFVIDSTQMNDVGLKRHPGADKYFTDHGL